MPEYSAPGVFIEETSFRARSIEGVSTSTAGFVGPCRFGPSEGMPVLVTSLGEFTQIFGTLEPIAIAGGATPALNYTALAARAFFDEGGKRLYVCRVVGAGAARAQAVIGAGVAAVKIAARFAGGMGNFRVTVLPRVSANVAVIAGGKLVGITQATDNDVIIVKRGAVVEAYELRTAKGKPTLLKAGARSAVALGSVIADGAFVLRVDVQVESVRQGLAAGPVFTPVSLHTGLTLSSRSGQSIQTLFRASGPDAAELLSIPIIVSTSGATNAASVAKRLFANLAGLIDPAARLHGNDVVVMLSGGADGRGPDVAAYTGQRGAALTDAAPSAMSGLGALESVEDVAIVACPGAAADAALCAAVARAMIAHCELMRWRVAVLDTPRSLSIAEVRAFRAKFNSKQAALYYPWVRARDGQGSGEILLPPSGFVAGIIARVDAERGVHKAPANEVVRGAIGFETSINKAQQDVLNPEGINCFRVFEGRGMRVWGARTVSSDPEWKYVNIRRYFCYLEQSIERGTRWAVFEPNAERLWASVRVTIEAFLIDQWRSGVLLGATASEAFFVRCDRSTMTQSDLDNGRLVCLIGVAALKPAEFVILRFGQWTADRPL